MEFVKQKYTILEQEIPALKLDDYSHSHFREEYINNMYKHIERCGRVCYRSEDRITDGSAERFVKGLIKTKHYSVLEHGTIYLDYPTDGEEDWAFYDMNPYSWIHLNKKGNFSITTNYRVIIENNRESDLKYLTVPDNHYIRHTVLMTTCIQVYKELTRQRYLSPSIESTRYCNYSVTSKFGDMKFVVAPWFKYIKEGKVIKDFTGNSNIYRIGCTKDNPEGFIFKLGLSSSDDMIPEFKTLEHLYNDEQDYTWLTKEAWKPEEAAYILPQGLAAEAVFTGYDGYWDYVFDLRARDKTGKAHPLVKEIMIPLSKEFEERGWINKIG